ncbi:MAG: hypothetical protein ABJB61_03435 [bacterium]
MTLPITGDPLNSNDNLVATKAVESVRFLPLTPKISFLKNLLVALRTNAGYQEGDWDNPQKDGDRDTFYTFIYDWRRDNVRMAQQLIERISALKNKLGKPELRFNVVTVSMGGLIARYAAMYGNADLPYDKSPPWTRRFTEQSGVGKECVHRLIGWPLNTLFGDICNT